MKKIILIPLLLTAVFACEETGFEPSQDTSHVEDTSAPDQSQSASSSELNFIPDPGIRVNYASNSWAKAALQDDGTTLYYLFYQDHEGNGDGPAPQKAVTSIDGLDFDASQARPYSPGGNSSDPDLVQNDPRSKLMPEEEDGSPIWRRFNATMEGLKTETSQDGVNFQQDDGFAYLYHNTGEGYENDQGIIGYNDTFVAADGSIVFLYIADMQPGGYNNVRMARSQDNGATFTWVKANVLDDAKLVDEGGHPSCSYVDPKSTTLPNGSVRIFLMTQACHPSSPGNPTGYIHSFLSTDGENFSHEDGLRLQPEDFDWDTFGFVVYSLNDPVVIPIEDGRYRMYVTALICESQNPVDCDRNIAGSLREVLVSATTP
jgi:hypothetical protein